MEEIYCLKNDSLDRVYFTKEENDFDKSNFAKFLKGDRKSIGGFTDFMDFEVLNQGYDTLVFNSRKIDTVHILGEFIKAKEYAILENKEFISWQFRSFDFLVKRKSFGFYKVTILYQNLFQFSFNEKMIQIKILSVAFYTMNLQLLYELLFTLVLELFDLHFRESFIVSRVDYAIDVKFNFDIFNNVVKGLDFTKLKEENFKIYHEPKGKSVTYTNGVAQICLYDKVLEVYHGKTEKIAIYDKLFNIDFTNAFEIEKYKNSGSQIMRFEYRLDNTNDFLIKYKMNIEKIFYKVDYVKGFITYMINKHTRLEIPEDNLYKLILNSTDFNIEVENFEEERYLQIEIENAIKSMIGYVSSIHSKMMYLDHELKNDFNGVDEVFDYIKFKLYDYNYFEKVEEKLSKLNCRKYK